jgi:uncharacterized protein (DUF1501 family)
VSSTVRADLQQPARVPLPAAGQDALVPDSTASTDEFLDRLPARAPGHDQRPAGLHDGCDCGGEAASADPWRRGFTRRRVVQGTSAMVAALGLQTVTTRYAFAATAKAADADTVVVISLRGGWDTLNIVVPTFEDRYYQQRPNIAVPKAAALPLARGFGLHPALKQLHGLYGSGSLAPVVAVGTPDTTLSHFEAMDTLERGTATAGTPSGWLNRVLQARGEKGVFSAVQMGSSLPLSLAGDAPALTMNGIQSFGLAGYDDVKVKAANAFGALYKGVKHPVADQVRDTVAALSKVGSIPATPAAAAAGYPQNSGLAGALMDVARLVKANLGMTIATLDVGGWDMHTNEGRVDGGDMLNHLTELDAALAGFVADLGAAYKNVTVVLISEFGRTIRENGSVGTDHGHGQAMLVLGGGIKGGTVYGAWPGLTDQAQFTNGSLAARTDYRDVLGEVLAKRGRVGSFAKIFPDHKPKAVGLANAR